MDELYDLSRTGNYPAFDQKLSIKFNNITEDLLKKFKLTEFFCSLLYSNYDIEIYKIILNKCSSLDENELYSLLNRSIKANNVDALSAILNVTTFNINLSKLICGVTSDEILESLLYHEKIYSDSEALKLFTNLHQPQWLNKYLQSDKYISPDLNEVTSILEEVAPFESTLEVLLKDYRIDPSNISKKVLLKMLEFPDIQAILQEKIPNICNPIIENRESKKRIRQEYLSRKWNLFGND
jgi:hypothetical protein